MSGPAHAPVSAFRWSDIGDWGTVRLLDVDPDFAVGPVEDDGSLRYSPMVPALRLADGTWTPPDALARVVGVVVLDGLLLGIGTLFARPDVRLLGPGDIVDGRMFTTPEMEWRALGRAHLAVLDSAFVLAARRRPALIVGLARRLSEAEQEQHVRAQICAMPRVEERILALLCHLAQRWGHVTPDGVRLTLPITHELLGSLIGARRPTVSLAIRALAEQGLLRRRDETWILPTNCSTWQGSGVPGWTDPRNALRAASGGVEA